ncbi:MAG: sigma 54-interacting transcriptional regulator, partial [Eubacterium sp.]
MKAAVLECLSPLLLTDLEQVTDMAIMIINTKGKIICYSKGCERIEGFKREDVIGLSPDELYNPKQFPNVNRAKRSMVLDTLNTGQLYHEHLDYYTTINGTEANILCSTYPLHDKSGSLQGVLCIYQEVSEYLEMISISNKNQSDKPHNLPALNGTQYTFDAIIGTHPKMQKALYRGKVAAKADAPVLIFGETGTGKELFAQSIHNESACRNGNFVAINCSAIPDTLLESTLFGTVRGSYTGATDRKGLFEEAQNGTLFLDELNAMDIGLQSKLLRVLETGKFRRVGAQEEKNCQCRIISALNEDPFAAIENNIIRADLYYRLAVFSIELPPLRARKEDILATSKSFLSNLAPV